jgi:hypothetical protein
MTRTPSRLLFIKIQQELITHKCFMEEGLRTNVELSCSDSTPAVLSIRILFFQLLYGLGQQEGCFLPFSPLQMHLVHSPSKRAQSDNLISHGQPKALATPPKTQPTVSWVLCGESYMTTSYTTSCYEQRALARRRKVVSLQPSSELLLQGFPA